MYVNLISVKDIIFLSVSLLEFGIPSKLMNESLGHIPPDGGE